MNDKYLWDRSGEPDPEIQKLEEVLGTLRYQPRPLDIPADIRIARKRNYFPLAIAAAISFLVIGAGLWFHFSNSPSAPGMEAARNSENQPPPPSAPDKSGTQNVVKEDQPAVPQRRVEHKPTLVAANKHRQPRVESQPALTPQELAEKEQVLFALRLASAKLNVAQRKVQGLPQRSIFRNQNRIG